LISTIVFSLVKCHHIDCHSKPIVDIPSSQIRNTIITSKNLYFWYQEFNCY